MMKLTIAIVAALVTGGGAQAELNYWAPPSYGPAPDTSAGTWGKAEARVRSPSAEGRPMGTLPPVEFDHPFEGKVIITVINDDAQMQAACSIPFPYVMGCAHRTGPVCVIQVRDEATLRKNHRTHDLVVRHETGHCNGWKGHDGARPAPDERVTR